MSPMIKSIDIKNFKSLAACRIDNLSRVNLFVGKNNVGKSSLLEAISLFLEDGSPACILKLLENRGLETIFRPYGEGHLGKEIQANIATLYTGRNISRFMHDPLVLTFSYENKNESTVSMQLGYSAYEKFLDPNGEVAGRQIFVAPEEADGMADVSPGLIVAIGDSRQFYPFRNMDIRVWNTPAGRNCEFVRPSSIFSSDNASLFDRIAMTGLQQWLVKALNIIDPRIRDVNFLQDPLSNRSSRTQSRVPMVVLEGDESRYQLRSMGDGVNRLLAIVLSMLNCKGGVLLVDEFENGLHYTALCQLWEMVFQLAEALDVQVFVTSHSNDCIRSFIEADKKSDGTITRLENRSGEIVGVPYTDPDELEYISRNSVEIR